MKALIKTIVKKAFYLAVPNKWLIMSGKSLPHEASSIYLTYDDGPDPDVTPVLLDLLDEYGAKATFFVIGREADKYPDIVRDICVRGHRVANHSYEHINFGGSALQVQLAEIDKTNQRLRFITGQECKVFRPPQGALSIKLLLGLRCRGMRTIQWTRDSDDCRYPADKVIEHIQQTPLQGDDIVLMHDDSIDNVAITQAIFDQHGKDFSFKAI